MKTALRLLFPAIAFALSLKIWAGELKKQAPSYSGVYFTGHLNPDSDSIMSAIAAAELFGGIAARLGAMNPESLWLLKKFSLKEPVLLQDGRNRKYFLLDFNQQTQAPGFITPDRIVGIVDHHALRSSAFSLNLPVEIDIRPWGSTCTIVAFLYDEYGRHLRKELAAALLGGILSDTMNLRSPTTTREDRRAAVILAERAGIKDTAALAMSMFRARSELDGKSVRQILKLDFKEYSLGGKKAGFGVAETVSPGSLLKMKDTIISDMELYRKESGLDLIFFAIVDSLRLRTYLLLPEGEESTLAAGAYGGGSVDGVMDLGGRVSRKRQIVPPLQKLLREKKHTFRGAHPTGAEKAESSLTADG